MTIARNSVDHVRDGDQAAAVDHQAAVGIERDDLAFGESGREAQGKRNAEPHVAAEKIRSFAASSRTRKRCSTRGWSPSAYAGRPGAPKV